MFRHLLHKTVHVHSVSFFFFFLSFFFFKKIRVDSFLSGYRSRKTSAVQSHVYLYHCIRRLSNFLLRCNNCLNSTAPDYLTELLRIYKPTRQLRSSSDTSILCIPTVRTHSLGKRSFSYAAPTVWNTLSYEIRSSTPSHPSNHHLKLIFFSSPTDCVLSLIHI